MQHWRNLRGVTLVWLASFGAMAGAAEPAYPARPINLVVPFPANSNSDYFARSLVKHVAPVLGAQFAVENRIGASGAIATRHVFSASPDGYTLLIARVGNLVVAPAISPELPYRPADFSFIGLLEVDPVICAASLKAPFKDFRQLFSILKQSPGKLRYSATGSASLQNLAVHHLMRLGGAKPGSATMVNFEGSPQSLAGLLAGEVDFICNSAGTLIAPIKQGKIRGLFSTAPGRMIELPDLPTATEVGIRGMGQLVGWTALLGPPGMPAPVLARWRAALRQMSQSVYWRADIGLYGGISAIDTAKDNPAFIRDQTQLIAQMVPLLKMEK